MLTKRAARSCSTSVSRRPGRPRRLGSRRRSPPRPPTAPLTAHGTDPRHVPVHGARAGRGRGRRRAHGHLRVRRDGVRDDHRAARRSRARRRRVLSARSSRTAAADRHPEPVAPPALDHIIRACLAKDRDDADRRRTICCCSSGGSGKAAAPARRCGWRRLDGSGLSARRGRWHSPRCRSLPRCSQGAAHRVQPRPSRSRSRSRLAVASILALREHYRSASRPTDAGPRSRDRPRPNGRPTRSCGCGGSDPSSPRSCPDRPAWLHLLVAGQPGGRVSRRQRAEAG